ncbi:hexokinase family protein [Hydromonas duriensis]|uniref:Hexokinase n=1 Tax=Hydromonas duriensis TaxID=1527608 RepID=A0A4R6Y4P6_9BURK|nr:hypothetical protein [Hydromonas duriensis]TDR28874.1 hexokinase [Hydromonas duriensis]
MEQRITEAIELLTLSTEQLMQIRDGLANKIAEGLAKDGQDIKALPAYMRRPSGQINGDAVVLDAGGTNVRAAHIAMQGQEVSFITEPQADRTLMHDAQTPGLVSPAQFFERQAALIQRICPAPEFNLGYCFSYPSTNTPDGDAALVTWTKGINVSNMVGVPLRKQLIDALAAQGQTAHHTPILNDTVTTLAAAAWMAPECDTYIGLIAGTGMNAAGFYRSSQITKLSADEVKGWRPDELMAVNLEIGNFHPPFLSHYDDELDAAGVNDHPGKQRLEKALGGKYTAELYGRIVGREACLALPDAWAFDPEAGSRTHAGHVTQLRRYHGLMADTATALINRSADLTAAALAGVLKSQDLSPEKNHTVGILAEGTLFWQTEGYRERVESTLHALIATHIKVRILHNTSNVDANFIGAACAALA